MKGESGISLCDTCSNCECIFQTGIVREQCDFYKKKTQHKDEYYQAIIDVLWIIDKLDDENMGLPDWSHDYEVACKDFRAAVLALAAVMALKGGDVK